MSFASIKDFRERATEDDMKELESFIMAQPKKAEAFPNEKYNFSYSSGSTYLRRQGYLGGEREQASGEIPEFLLRSGGAKQEFATRSFSIQKDILARIDKLSDDNWRYSKKAIVNQLFDEALTKYGY